MIHFKRMRLAPLLLLAALGCGGDDEGGERGLQSGLLGIYAIQTWTENSMGCDVEGASILESEQRKKLAVQFKRFLVKFLLAVPCVDAEDCAEALDAGPFATLLGGAVFEDGSDAEGWEGTSDSWTFLQGRCIGVHVEHRLTGEPKASIRLESTTFNVDFPVDEEPSCDEVAVRKAAASQPCAGLTVITGTYESEAPE